jgi:glycosyltransferase involved in cell wall biosynthesis
MKISLIITVLNAEKCLPKAIDSFLAQEYINKELIILDGKSQDGSHKIIAEYCKKFPHLIKWINEPDLGISHARNIALKHVTGDIVGFLGADDFLHKDFYVQMAYYADINPDFDVMYCNSYTVGNNSAFDNSAQITMTQRNLIKHCPIGSGESFYYRRAIFNAIKFNEKNRYSMDYELNMALVTSKKYRFFPVNISAVFNGSYGESISFSNSLKQRLETVVVQLKYARNFKEKFNILYRKKKLVLKNFQTFREIKKIIL